MLLLLFTSQRTSPKKSVYACLNPRESKQKKKKRTIVVVVVVELRNQRRRTETEVHKTNRRIRHTFCWAFWEVEWGEHKNPGNKNPRESLERESKVSKFYSFFEQTGHRNRMNSHKVPGTDTTNISQPFQGQFQSWPDPILVPNIPETNNGTSSHKVHWVHQVWIQ